MQQRSRGGMETHSPSQTCPVKLVLSLHWPSPSLIEFLGHNPDQSAIWQIARQTESGACIPGAGLRTVL